MAFELRADFIPTGDQPEAIKKLVESIKQGNQSQVLLGVTGSGKTFTAANLVAQLDRPTLVLSHNKTLAAQLYGEFKQFFPNNAVEYFISYYDYYQPEAYIASTNTYIEKDLAINEEIEKLRLAATSALLSGRRDVLVVASVSCIYGIGNPEEFAQNVIKIAVGDKIMRNKLLFRFVETLYSRTADDFRRGTFRVKGDTVDIFPAYADFAYRIVFFDDEIEEIIRIHPDTAQRIQKESAISIFPANLFVTGRDTLNEAIYQIQDDLVAQLAYFEKNGQFLEAKRLKERTELDLEMMRELGYCSGIENYSRYFDRRKTGDRPFCLLDYFPKDYLVVIDESHVTIPQFRAMWGGDRSRKTSLVEFGFRLPSALDNRPLTFQEFESMLGQTLFVSATPGDYELVSTGGEVVEQIIRPTGLLDPPIEVRPSKHQIDDLIGEIHLTISEGHRVLITTLTKRMAEELAKYLDALQIKCRYIHSEVKTLDRVDILRDLRLGVFDVLIGVNLLREGLDLPEVALVAILDADKEGFLRNARSLIQTVGRAARNASGRVIMYADRMTDSMKKTIGETERRRKIQETYNQVHGITPRTISKSTERILEQTQVADKAHNNKFAPKKETQQPVNTQNVAKNKASTKPEQLNKRIEQTQKAMEQAAKSLDFITAAQLRDELFELKKLVGK